MYNPDYHEMGHGGKYDIDTIRLQSLINKWNGLINAKIEGADITEETICEAYEDIEEEEGRLNLENNQ